MTNLIHEYPLVSVIIPNYNHARYLEQRLNTVFNQTYQNIEVIILDDCSSDNSLAIIEKYKNNPLVSHIIINSDNTGSPFVQWEKGMSYAKGELIWIAESDDYNELTFLDELINEWKKHKNVVLAFSSYVMFWDNRYLYSRERENQYFIGKQYLKKRLSRACAIRNASGVLFRRDAVDKISDYYKTYKNVGDYHFWCEIVALGNIIKINKNLTYWRQSNGSVTGSNLSIGNTSREDKRVYDYITKYHKLSVIEQYLAYAQHIMCYKNIPYDTEEIRKEILQIWDDGKLHYVWMDKVILWLIGSIERHFSILI